MKKFLEILKNIIIILLVIILLEVCYSKFVLKENPTKLFGISFLIVTTGSMEPTINPGELLVVAEQKTYEVDDVVTYKDSDGFLITHRIVQKDNGNMIAKGDANDLNDETCPINRIEGKVIYHSKKLGYFVLYFLKPLIVIYLIIIFVIHFFRIIFTNDERSSNNEEKDKITNSNK